jgi:hypothetical protein
MPFQQPSLLEGLLFGLLIIKTKTPAQRRAGRAAYIRPTVTDLCSPLH